jgi:hypothetical protein
VAHRDTPGALCCPGPSSLSRPHPPHSQHIKLPAINAATTAPHTTAGTLRERLRMSSDDPRSRAGWRPTTGSSQCTISRGWDALIAIGYSIQQPRPWHPSDSKPTFPAVASCTRRDRCLRQFLGGGVGDGILRGRSAACFSASCSFLDLKVGVFFSPSLFASIVSIKPPPSGFWPVSRAPRRGWRRGGVHRRGWSGPPLGRRLRESGRPQRSKLHELHMPDPELQWIPDETTRTIPSS